MALNEIYPDNHIPLAKNVEAYGEIEMKREYYKSARNNFKKAQFMRDTYLREKKKQSGM